MAIYHFSAKIIGRSGGRSAIASAAYRAGERLHDARLDRDHDYTDKAGVVHREILLPQGAPARWADRGTLWNEVEAGEKRKDAQLARDIEISLPRELGKAEAIRLAQDFVHEQFVANGMVADLNVHWTQARDGGEQPHAHVMLTMREVVPEREGQEEKGAFGKKVVAWNSTELLRDWRERWAELANARLLELGHDIRIDHRSYAEQGIDLEPQHKIGPLGTHRDAERALERAAEHRRIARRNGDRLRDAPEIALQALTQQHSTFTRQDMARFVDRHSDGAAQFATVMAQLEAAPELVRLGQDGRGRDRFTTREMLEAEQRMERAAESLAGRPTHWVMQAVGGRAVKAAERKGLVLGEEQRAALRHITSGPDLSLVVGTAGTGKSSMLGVARDAWEREGLTVRGATLSGIAAEGLEAGSGIASRTLASLEFGWKEGRDVLTSRDVLVIDEAGLVGSRQMERVLSRAQAAGAKVVLIGDPEQLQAIEAGAAFRALAERHGAAEIREVRRQREDWQRVATRELATERTAQALARYDQAGMVHAAATWEEAKVALVAGWDAVRRQSPGTSQVILAYTRDDVQDLNALAREQMRGSGALRGADQMVQTERGARAFAAGDRLMFLRNERGLGGAGQGPAGLSRWKAGGGGDGRGRNGPGGPGGVAVKNGTLGRVLEVASGGERLMVQLDGPGGTQAGPVVTFYTRDYAHLDHGYAATIHKAQGVTVDRTHVLASEHMDRHAAYVALTRHRDGVALHYGHDDFPDAPALGRRLGRERRKDTSLDYRAERDAEDLARRYAERRGLDPLHSDSAILVRASEQARKVSEPAVLEPAVKQGKFSRLKLNADRALARVPKGEHSMSPAEATPAPLLPAWRDPTGQGRDSLGRRTSPEELKRVANQAPAAMREVEAQKNYLRSAYRDPDGAAGALDRLIETSGHDLRVAARTLREAGPEVLGRLQGRDGWFAGRNAQDDRAHARFAAAAIGGSLEREAAAREDAMRHHTREVEQQRARDAVEVPGLSKAALDTLNAVQMAQLTAERPQAGECYEAWQRRQEELVCAAWREGRADPRIAHELDGFLDAASRRHGEEGLRNASRGASSGRRLEMPGALREHQAGLDELARCFVQGRNGMALSAAWNQRIEQEEREVERVRARQEERERRGLPLEPEQDRERQRRERDLGLER